MDACFPLRFFFNPLYSFSLWWLLSKLHHDHDSGQRVCEYEQMPPMAFMVECGVKLKTIPTWNDIDDKVTTLNDWCKPLMSQAPSANNGACCSCIGITDGWTQTVNPCCPPAAADAAPKNYVGNGTIPYINQGKGDTAWVLLSFSFHPLKPSHLLLAFYDQASSNTSQLNALPCNLYKGLVSN